MAISKTGLVDGAPGSLSKLADRVNALPATEFAKIANQAIYAGADHTALAASYNAFLVKLKASGIMTAD
jgi:hypothetical protein